MIHSRAKAAAIAALVLLSGGIARAQAHEDDGPDLTLRKAPPEEAKIAPPAAVVTTTPEDGYTGEMPWGFYRDRQGRVMQVSFDFGRRLWLGVGYAPHRTPAGQTEISPAAFDFGVSYDELSGNGRTRRRFNSSSTSSEAGSTRVSMR